MKQKIFLMSMVGLISMIIFLIGHLMEYFFKINRYDYFWIVLFIHIIYNDFKHKENQ